MPDNATSAHEAWSKDATSGDVITWALARTARLMAQWGIACCQHDEAEMMRTARGFRDVVKRMEQFRRMLAKQWAAAATANSTTEKNTK